MNTHIPEQRTRKPLGQRIAAVATASVVAIGAATWSAGGFAGTEAANPGAVVDAAPGSRTIGNGNDSYAPIVAKVAPAVVTIRSEQRIRQTQQQLPFMNDPRFRDFFGEQFGEGFPAPQPRRGGLGSGVIINSDGYILTNHHVIDGADRVRVELIDRRVFDAQVVGSDAASDLAVLKIEGHTLPTVPFGDSESVNVGDVVLALGNPLGVGQTVTMGIISAKGRATGLGDGSFEDFLQTDAPINSGNSGGALVNTRGELVGINAQILSPSGGNIGIGFAIPVNMARNVMDALITDGKVRRGRLGVTVQGITSDLAKSLRLDAVAGALVSDVSESGPAARAGLARGDVITAIDGAPITDSNELRNRIALLGPGAKVELTIIRNGKAQTVAATLEELPSRAAAQATPRGPGDERTAGLMLTPDDRGLVVRQVQPDGPAADAGIRAGDVITQVDGQAVRSAADLRSALGSGDRPALVLLRRGDQHLFVSLDRVS